MASGETIEYLTVVEFARAIERTPRSVQRYVRQGRIYATKSPTGAILIPQGELSHFRKPPRAAPPGRMRTGGLRDAGGRLRVVGSGEAESLPEESLDPILQTRRPSVGLASVPLARHEEVILRLGWTEGQLELNRKLLQEAGRREQALSDRLQEAENRLEAQVEARLRAEERVRHLEARLRLFEDRN
ncbi:MAG: hypothetical protein AB1758_12450 [Candidatus Eremiobacterota bacterium]